MPRSTVRQNGGARQAVLVAVIAAFAVTSWFWPRPRLAGAAEGRALRGRWQRAARAASIAMRVVSVATFALVLGLFFRLNAMSAVR